MFLAAVKFRPIELPSPLMLSTSRAAVSTSRTSLSPPYCVLIDENVSTRVWMLGTILLTCARTLAWLLAAVVAHGRELAGSAPALAVQGGPAPQPVADEARLIGGPEL